nr:cyclodeaminase/cyclohydrolase family protein [Aminipila terrae]
MKLIEMKVNEYLDILKSDAPAPGGGSVSALAGAQGVGLVMMVCDLTLGKEKFADYQEICTQAKADSKKLYDALREAVDKDTEAFNLVSAAFKMPKATEEEKRSEATLLQRVH